MVTLLLISTIAAILALGPRTVYATKEREICPTCRYDLGGLPDKGTCPECGGQYLEKIVAKVGWMFKWTTVPRIMASMAVPAIGPFISIAALAAIMRWQYGWTWNAAWYQSAERDLDTAAIFTTPFLLNSWLLIGIQRAGPVAQGVKLRGVDSPTFWPSLLLSTLAGSLAMTSVGVVAWIDRVYYPADLLYMVAIVVVLAAIACGHLAARHWNLAPP